VTYLVHGEPQAASQLRDLMKKELRWNVQMQSIWKEYRSWRRNIVLKAMNVRITSHIQQMDVGNSVFFCVLGGWLVAAARRLG